MATRWRGMLAPIDEPTGDGRRMAPGAFTNRPLPLPLKWQRTDEDGHTTSVVIGSMDKLDITDDAVWGEGELFDDASPTATPRLAEDVAEAKLLLSKRVIGPSVDPGSAQAVTVMKGSSEPLNDTMIERYWMQHGEMPETELLFTDYEIAAATLVPVPAFAQCRPFELLDTAGAPMADAARAIMAAAPLPPLDPALFRQPELATYTPATMVDLGNGWTHVFGHVATHDVCHVGMRGVCTTAPYSDQDYVPFHRYSTTSGGHELPVLAGRLTTGHGRLENLCRCHPGNDDHACGNLSFGAAIAHHDRMEPLAYVCVGEDEANNAIWFSGVLNPDASAEARRVLGRRRVSGDWRDYGASMELVEVLVLARREPGFPLPRVSVENGRQRSLTAAGVIMPPRLAVDEFTNETADDRGDSRLSGDGLIPLPPEGVMFDYEKLGAAVARSLMQAAEAASVTAAVRTSWSDMPIAPDGHEWEVGAAKRRLADWAGDDITGKYARAFLYRDDDADPDLKTAYGLPIADVIDGTLTIVPAAVRNAASRLPQMKGVPADQRDKIRSVLDGLLDRTREERGDMAADADCGEGRHRMPDGTCMDDDAMAITAAVRSDWSNLPLAPDGREWDKNAAVRRLVEWADGDISGKYSRAFIWRDPDGDPDLQGTYKLPIADVIDGRLTIVPNAVRNVASRLEQTQGLGPDDERRVRSVLDTLFDRIHEQSGEASMTAASAEGGHTGGMVALRMADADAARMAVPGGLPADDMHMTLAYLGDAAAITPEVRERIMRGMNRIAKKVASPIEAEGFSVNAFNPGDANERPTAIVMGVNGAMLGSLQRGVCKTLDNCEGFEMPEQHEPWAAHVTLAYDDDLGKIAEYADRVGPLTFDRLRVAFAGEVTDIPLGEIIKVDEVEQGERDRDGAVYARTARANQLAAQLWLIDTEARREQVAALTERISATALAAAE